MFHIRAAFSEQLELETTIERAREFFGDVKNFVELMPNVERITAEAGGIARWLIRAEVPVIGSIRQAFTVVPAPPAPDRIEWSPAAGEKKNLLRYTAWFENLGQRTRVRIEQRVELRRASARELHMLAGLAGESRLSAAMQQGVTEMMRTFLRRAKTRLEK
ncbi:MAG TPA: hypothetical protein VEY09_05935 [Pyrinomonadaceae bacterium]|nr:hypothetical protein [Pyrinomonadaceae bacterium]